MPTGYTQPIQDGKLSFKDFALTCARAFGACVAQRDDPSNELPKKQEYSQYHSEELAKALKERDVLLQMSDADADKEAQSAFKSEVAYFNEREAERNRIADNYKTMLDEVRRWTPPTEEHLELKLFMEQQIIDSIKFDTGSSWMEAPVAKSGKEWKEEQLKSLDWSIDYHEKNWAEEKQRVDERNQWIADLYDSLSRPMVAVPDTESQVD